ncbi:MAG TPA: CPBP family intramembrane glutamic endopeptidase [Thermoplasmata archaeon]|nr:CPBP family intramembrane glutamic endopeptidase [Thermoplasmata archaeon]
MAGWPPDPPDRRVPAPRARYWAGVAITVVAIVSQYFVPVLLPASLVVYGSLPGDLAVVYGIPVVAFLGLVGTAPLRHGTARLRTATWEGLRWYGGLSVLAIVLVVLTVIAYSVAAPQVLHQFETTPNPALASAQSDPWLYVGLSFVVGAFEETIFRGWIFGYWRDVGGSWFGPAVWTSVVFAGVHLYYGIAYGAASPLVYPTLFLLGFSFAATYRYSGGNLVVPALLHGENDATAYLTLVDPTVAVLLHYLVILVGLVIAAVAYFDPRPAAGRSGPPAG